MFLFQSDVLYGPSRAHHGERHTAALNKDRLSLLSPLGKTEAFTCFNSRSCQNDFFDVSVFQFMDCLYDSQIGFPRSCRADAED